MVRFRQSGDRSSTLGGSVDGESVPIADRWSLGKGLALASSREIAILSLRFAFAPGVRPRGDLGACSLRFGAREGTSDSAAGTGISLSRKYSGSSGARLGSIRPLGGDAPTSLADASTFFASNAAAATRCDSRSNPAGGDLVSDDCASEFDVVARRGRRRTSTLNEGTARLNVILDSAHRWLIRLAEDDLASQSGSMQSATIL